MKDKVTLFDAQLSSEGGTHKQTGAIYKYLLSRPENSYGVMPIDMRKGAKVLSADMHNGNIHLWALADPDGQDVIRNFAIIGTGHRIDIEYSRLFTKCSHEFIATIQQSGFVWHIFEIKEVRGE